MCIWHHKLCNAKTGVGPTFTWPNEALYKGSTSLFVRRKFHFQLLFIAPVSTYHNLLCKTRKTLDEINYLKYISSYRQKKSNETRARNITSL